MDRHHVDVGVENTDRSLDRVEFDDQLSKLLLIGLNLTGEFGTLGDQPVQQVGVVCVLGNCMMNHAQERIGNNDLV